MIQMDLMDTNALKQECKQESQVYKVHEERNATPPNEAMDSLIEIQENHPITPPLMEFVF